MAAARMIARADGTRLACRQVAGAGPGLIFLPGYRSDMAGSKAAALLDWGVTAGRAVTLFDYAGCGASEGEFAEETLESWLGDALTILDAATEGPQIVIGSSMGGWLMLHLALLRPHRVAGLVGIAAAPDFTDWGFTPDQKAVLLRDGIVFEPNAYGPEPTPTTLGFWKAGQAMRLLDGDIAIDCPVRLLHGQRDPDVPWQLALDLAARLRSADVQVALIKEGDHRLSRPGDIALLIATVAALG